MGALKKFNRWKTTQRKAELERTKMYNLSKEIQRFYATHLVSLWQGERIKEIRALHEGAQKNLARKHDIAASQTSEMFAQFELDYLYASQQFKEKNPGEEWHPSGVKGIFYKAFWSNLMKRGKALGINLHGEEAKQN